MIPNYRTSRDAAAAETAMPENPIPALKKEAQNGFARQKNSSNTAGTQNATVTDAVVGAVVTRDDDDRSKRLGQGESGSRATPSLRDVERLTRRDQGKPRSVQEQSGRQYHRRNRFRGGKNSAYTAPVGFLLGWRNTSGNGRENRASVTTSHLFWPKLAGARRVLLLVDRGNLGDQTLKEFQQFVTPDVGRKFAELYNVQHLQSAQLDRVSRVCISTIQRLYSMLHWFLFWLKMFTAKCDQHEDTGDAVVRLVLLRLWRCSASRYRRTLRAKSNTSRFILTR